MRAVPILRLVAVSILALFLLLGVSSASPIVAAPASTTTSGDVRTLDNCSSMPPVVVTTDDKGYTTWPMDYTAAGCDFPTYISKFRYPLDLGGTDPASLDDVSLAIKYYVITAIPYDDGSYGNMSWTLNLNRTWNAYGFYGGKSLRTLSVGSDWQEEVIRQIDPTLIVDGENNFHLIPGSVHDNGDATTAIAVGKYELRATVNNIDIKSVSPEPNSENVDYRRQDPSRIQVEFTQPVDPKSVNPDSFQLYYIDNNGDKAFVSGKFRFSDDKKSFEYRPTEDLLDGVLYTARIWVERGRYRVIGYASARQVDW